MATKQEALIYKLVGDGKSQTAVAKQFGITQPTVSGIIKRVEKELRETGKIVIEKETSYPCQKGSFFCSSEQNEHIEKMIVLHGSYSKAMRAIINNSMKHSKNQ